MSKSERQRAIRLVKLIANARPDSARLLFNKYGIDVPVSEKTLFSAIVEFGQPFITDLAKELASAKFTGPSADGGSTATDESSFWETDWEQISTGLSGITGIINNLGSGVTSIWNNLSGKTNEQADQYAEMQYQLELQQMDTERRLAQQRTIIYVVAGVVVVGLIAFFAMQKK